MKIWGIAVENEDVTGDWIPEWAIGYKDSACICLWFLFSLPV